MDKIAVGPDAAYHRAGGGELGVRAFRICELLRFPIDYVTQAISVSTEPRVARARPLGCPLSRRLHR